MVNNKLRDLLLRYIGRIKISQAELARRLDKKDRSTVSKWIDGTNRPSIEDLHELSDLFSLNDTEQTELFKAAGREKYANLLISRNQGTRSASHTDLSNDNLAVEPTIDFAEAEAAYRNQVIENYKDLSFSGLGELSLEDIPAEQIFVHLTLTTEEAELPQGVDQPGEKKGRQSSSINRESRPIKLAQALRKNVVIVGEPGAGKSTLLRWLAVAFAQKNQRELRRLGFETEENRLPIFVKLGPLSDYYLKPESRVIPNWIETLPEHISQQQNFPDLSPLLLRQALRQGRCLLLLDGLDEIVDQRQRNSLLSSFAEMARPYPDNRLVISSRPSGVEAAEGIVLAQFQRCQIARFDPPQLQRFFRFWYTRDPHVPIEVSHRKADVLYAKLQGSSSLLELATTPLIATILILLWHKDEALPNSQVQLYERCCYTLIEAWEKKHDVPHNAIFKDFSVKDRLAMLAHLAYAIHRREKGTHASGEYLADILAGFFVKKELFADKSSAKAEAQKSLKILGLLSSLFQYLGDDLYGFLHPSFQVYLAARYIAEQPDPQYIVMKDMHKYWWRQVHVLVIAHLSSDAESLDKASNLMLTIFNYYQPWSRWLSMLDLASPTVFISRPLFRSILPHIRHLKFHHIMVPLVGASLLLIFVPWVLFRLITLYFCPVKLHVAQLLEREYILVVDGYLAAGFPRMTPQLSKILSAHARLLLWRYIYTTVKLSKNALPCVYLVLKEYFKEHKDESLNLIQRLVNVITYSADREVQASAIECLGELGQTSVIVIETLVEQINYQFDEADVDSKGDERGLQRNMAAQSLGKLGVYSEPVVTALIHALEHQYEWVRESAARSLGQLKHTDGRIIDKLINLLQKENEHPAVHKAVIESLGQIGLVEPRILEALVKALGYSHHTRQAAINELARLARSNLEVIDALIHAVSQKWSWNLYAAVIDCLVNVGQTELEVIKYLLPYLSHSSSSVKLVATGALINLGNIDSSIEVVLQKLLMNDNPDLRSIAVEQVSEIGQISEQTIEILTNLLHSDLDSRVRERAALTLGKLQVTSAQAISALIYALDDVTVRWHGFFSIDGFQQYGWQIDVEQLQKVSLNTVNNNQIEYYSYDVAIVAAFSLGLLGKTDDIVIQALIRALHNRDARVREEAAMSLGALGVTSEVVISALKEVLDDPYLDYRSGEYPIAKAAAISLVRLGKTKEAQAGFSNFRQQNEDEVQIYLNVQLAKAVHLNTDEDVIISHADIDAIKNLLNSGISKKDLANCFIEVLKHKNKNVRIAAADGLGELGYLDDNVISALMRVAGILPEFSEDIPWTTPASAAIVSLGRLPIEDSNQLKRVIKFLERHRKCSRSPYLSSLAFYAVQQLMKKYPFPD